MRPPTRTRQRAFYGVARAPPQADPWVLMLDQRTVITITRYVILGRALLRLNLLGRSRSNTMTRYPRTLKSTTVQSRRYTVETVHTHPTDRRRTPDRRASAATRTSMTRSEE